jgi:signal transduction histidine kinase
MRRGSAAAGRTDRRVAIAGPILPRPQAGFGLGLSIAQAHGARIRVEGSVGAGAQFTVALKVA